VRTLAHISDLHFGTEDPVVARGLLAELEAVAPALVVVSGDLTQRARRDQFAAARAFLDSIPAPLLVVPGNHDVPLYDVGRRFLSPLGRFRRYVSDEVNPSWSDDELLVVGVNTARSNVWKDGRISLEQIAGIRARLCAAPAERFKVLVSHHPFIPPPDDPAPSLVGRGLLALEAAAVCGADLVLSGHLHVGYTGDVRAYHVTIRRSILVAQAGTAISQRRRGEPNAYNVITVDPPRLSFVVRSWDGAQFTALKEAGYVKEGEEWVPLEASASARPGELFE
jgi:3',5'-cyclic AMP phosphodiesterase CpdA